MEDRTYRDEVNEAKEELKKIVDEIVDKNESEEDSRRKLIDAEHVEFTKDGKMRFTE